MNKNKRTKPEIKFEELTRRGKPVYLIIVDNEKMRVNKRVFEIEKQKYLRIKSENKK
ncbi:MAG: hypothetical protein WC998_07590 [Candidatus Paceibacterota bacterium]